ncbi:hypothetical protein ACOSP7_003073 [Xanthoceras sorbifolium]
MMSWQEFSGCNVEGNTCPSSRQFFLISDSIHFLSVLSRPLKAKTLKPKNSVCLQVGLDFGSVPING